MVPDFSAQCCCEPMHAGNNLAHPPLCASHLVCAGQVADVHPPLLVDRIMEAGVVLHGRATCECCWRWHAVGGGSAIPGSSQGSANLTMPTILYPAPPTGRR